MGEQYLWHVFTNILQEQLAKNSLEELRWCCEGGINKHHERHWFTVWTLTWTLLGFTCLEIVLLSKWSRWSAFIWWWWWLQLFSSICWWYDYIFVCVSLCVLGGGGGLCAWCMCVHLLCYANKCLYCRCRITSSFSVYKNTKWAMEWMTSDLQRWALSSHLFGKPLPEWWGGGL